GWRWTHRTSARRCACPTSVMACPWRTARSTTAIPAARLVAQDKRLTAKPARGCDEPAYTIHLPASRFRLLFRGMAVRGGFPPCCPASREIPLCKRDERSERTPVPMPPGRGFFFPRLCLAAPRMPIYPLRHGFNRHLEYQLRPPAH